MTGHASLEEYLHTVGTYIAERVGTDQQALIQAMQKVWDSIYRSGATSAPDAPPRPVNAVDYLQGIQEGYEKGYQDGREEGGKQQWHA